MTLGALADVLRDDSAARGVRGAAVRARAAQRRARLPQRLDRPRAAPRRALLRRRLQDQLARAGRRAADRLAPSPGRARARDGAPPLSAAGAALHRRAAPLPALAAADYDAERHLGGALYLFVRGMVGRTRRPSTGRRAASSRGGPRRSWSSGCRTCWTVRRERTRARPVRRPLRAALGDAWRRSTWPACWPRRTSTSPAASASSATSTTRSCCSGPPFAVRAPRIGTCSSTSRRSARRPTSDLDEPVDLTTLTWPDPGAWVAPSPPAHWWPATRRRCGSTAPASTSTATGARSSASPRTSSA